MLAFTLDLMFLYCTKKDGGSISHNAYTSYVPMLADPAVIWQDDKRQRRDIQGRGFMWHV